MSLSLSVVDIASTKGEYIFPHALISIDMLEFLVMCSPHSLNNDCCCMSEHHNRVR